ncbi:MAG TPA: GntR family transcriptional regulator [Defluviitoga tunisiensis]|nr:GntR family transcriptional regulator [Defluviitoga tunisiensis]HOL87239.1 GntR family transcriptional regulator [Defluviitoga tunisiensis]HPP10165.1 GntR family transcriptional regulator [Defluviitoga tunisiensis]HPZ29587.1 GntR family transcriptional regulator [Defluviitoga sp.]
MKKEDKILYKEVENYIKDLIKKNNLKPGDLLPTEAKLEERLGVSRTTVRAAILELQYQGYVIKRQGKGTFVADNIYEERLPLLKSFTEDAEERGLSASSIVLKKDIILPNEKIAHILGISKSEKVLKLSRVRCINDEPIQVSTSYLPLKEIKKMDWREIDFSKASLYKELETAGIVIDTGEESIYIDLATKLDEKLLNVKAGSPILVAKRVVFNDKKKPIEYALSRIKGEKHRTMIKLKREH